MKGGEQDNFLQITCATTLLCCYNGSETEIMVFSWCKNEMQICLYCPVNFFLSIMAQFKDFQVFSSFF